MKYKQRRKKKTYIKLFISIILIVVLVSLFFIRQSYKRNQENELNAQKIGSQIQLLGDATKKYIDIRKNELATLSVSKNNGNDPGPRECDKYSNTCFITYKTLINEGLLDPKFQTLKFKYNISIRKEGSVNNYKINALIITTESWKNNNGKIENNLINIALKNINNNGGTTINNTEIWGKNGDWFLNTYTYPSIHEQGQIGIKI